VAIEHEYGVGKPDIYVGKKANSNLSFSKEGCFDINDPGKTNPLVGLAQVTILPPESLFLPVLPVQEDGKLLFGLCAKCLKGKRQKFCHHKDRRRALTNVWTIPEICFAIECGYKLIRVHEALIYKEKAKPFKKFYNRLAHMKLEAEGFPDWADTEEKQCCYVTRLNQQVDWLDLDVARIRKNPSRRDFAKLCSNCALGKLSQNTNKRTVHYCWSWEEIAALKYDPTLRIVNIFPMTSKYFEVVTEKRQEFQGYARNTQASEPQTL
jgi:hypothetical protein